MSATLVHRHWHHGHVPLMGPRRMDSFWRQGGVPRYRFPHCQPRSAQGLTELAVLSALVRRTRCGEPPNGASENRRAGRMPQSSCQATFSPGS